MEVRRSLCSLMVFALGACAPEPTDSLTGESAAEQEVVTGVTYYVGHTSCSNAGPGTSPSAPWCDFTPVNSRTFNPGDTLLLARGETWNQELVLHGNGTQASPITVGAYGTGGRPSILRSGKESDRGVRMTDVSFWTVRDLEIGYAGIGILAHYPTAIPAGGTSRQGLKFENIVVHDIYGIYHNSGSGVADHATNSAGILVTAPALYAQVPTLRDVVLSNIRGSHNQNSIILSGGNQPETLQGITLTNLYLQDDDARQPNTPHNVKAWEFNGSGNLEGWNTPIGMTAQVSGGALNTSSSSTESYIHSPAGLNINPSDYRYVRIRLKNQTAGTLAFLYFRRPGESYFQPGNVVRITGYQSRIDPFSDYTEYVVDMGTHPNWFSDPSQVNQPNTIDQLRLDFRSTGTVNIDSLRVSRRGCDDSLKLVSVRDVTLVDSFLQNEAACDSATGTAAIFMGAVTNATVVNTVIKNTPYFTGNSDMDGIDLESYNDGIRVLNSYFVGNAGPALNVLTRQCENIGDYSRNHEFSGNLFSGNGQGYTPAVGSIREATCGAPLGTGTIRTNIFRENGGLLTSFASPGFPGFTIPTTSPDWNLGVQSGYHAADGFTAMQGVGGWSYQSGAAGAFSPLSTYDAATESWGNAGSGAAVLTRFSQRPALTAGQQVARAWTVPSTIVNRPVSIRSRALIARPIDPSKQTAGLLVTRTRGSTVTTLWTGSLSASNWTNGVEQVSEVDVTAGDVIRFIVTNTSATPANVPTVSWAPSIGIR